MSTERSTTTELDTLAGCHVQVVPGARGTPLMVYTAGNPHHPPLVLLHGLFQSARSWSALLGQRQLHQDYYMVALDLRGHGASGKPPDTSYQDSQVWADDIHAVLTRLDLDHPMLVGWSYGGAIIGNYLRHYGDHALGGLVLMGTTSQFDNALHDSALVPHIPELLSADIQVSRTARERFTRLLTHAPPSPTDYQSWLDQSGLVPLAVRQSLVQHRETYQHEYAQVRVPTWVVHGQADTIVPPHHGHTLAAVTGGMLTVYHAVGHMPFVETNQFLVDFLQWLKEVC